MNDLIYQNGDLLSVKEGHIIHGCNTHGVMGGGIAKLVKEIYPVVYDEYRDFYQNNKLRLGIVQPVIVSPTLVVWNAMTQENYGADGMRYVSYDAVERCFSVVDEMLGYYYTEHDIKPVINIPLIGAGLGGGKWDIISNIIRNSTKNIVIVWEI